jgi:hypothetical protein
MRLRLIAIAAVAVLVVAGIALMMLRREITHAVLVERAGALGLGEFAVDVTTLGLDHATLANLHVDLPPPAGSLAISQIELSYSPSSLLERRFLRVDMTGLNLSGSLRDDAGFELDLPMLEVQFDSGDADATLLLQVSAAGGRLGVPAEFVSFEDLGFDLRIDAEQRLPAGVFAVGRVVDRIKPRRFGPFELRGRVAQEAGDRLQVGLDVSDLGGLMKLRIDGWHSVATGDGSLSFALDPANLAEIGDRLPQLIPALEGVVSELEGRLEIEGSAQWQGDALELSLILGLRDLGLMTDWGRFSGVNARVSLVGPAPFYMPRLERVTIEGFSAAAEPLNAIIDFRLRRDGTVEIPHLQWDFAGGTARTQGLYDPGSSQQAFTVEVSGVDLRALIELINLDGLTGEGTLAGEFPIYLDGDAIELRDAKLSTTSEGGWLRYRPVGAASAVAAGDEHLSQLAEILENFHFESIVISLNGNVLGDVQVSIQLKGANPDFYDGLPVELNTNVESQFGDLIRGGTAALSFATQVADALERSLRRRDERAKAQRAR